MFKQFASIDFLGQDIEFFYKDFLSDPVSQANRSDVVILYYYLINKY